jgi:cobalamin biosynthesis protein CbiD
VFRRTALVCASIFALTACADRLHNKEQVQKAIVERLQAHSGLDMNQLDVTTTSVSFDKNMAYATVSFHPKNDPAVNSGMTMKYTLEEQSGKWVVVKVGDGQGHGTPGHSGMTSGTLPPGHPQVDPNMPGTGAPEAK